MENALNFSRALEDAQRVFNVIQTKAAVRDFYETAYQKFLNWLNQCPEQGLAIELGSGLGPIKKYLPQVVTTDIIPYPKLDKVVDATKMPYENNSLKAILMLNVLHHIPNVEVFFQEAQRCLLPGGKIIITDPYPGIFWKLFLEYLHHENYDPQARDWNFKSQDPLNDANGAMAWMVFERDKEKFEKQFPDFRIIHFQKHTPFQYWFAGGLKNWTLLPNQFFIQLIKKIDAFFIKLNPNFGCFVDVVLEKK